MDCNFFFLFFFLSPIIILSAERILVTYCGVLDKEEKERKKSKSTKKHDLLGRCGVFLTYNDRLEKKKCGLGGGEVGGWLEKLTSG